MKLVCYIKEGHEQLAIFINGFLYDMDSLHPELPSSMSMFLNYWDDYLPLAKTISESIEQGKVSLTRGLPLESATLISPIPLPSSCRRALVFDGDRNVQGEVSEDPKPLVPFHFINHHSIMGSGNIACMPDHFRQLDFEMGVAIVVSSHCKNITADEADQYIGGYMIMNKIVVQEKFMNNNIVNVLGPWLITPDELEPFLTDTPEGKTGTIFSLHMKCTVNDELVKEFNLAEMKDTFAEVLESCAYGADLQAGDIIGTGSFNFGTYLVQNESKRWLQIDDVITIEVEGLGVSTVTITADESDFSLKRLQE